MQFYPTIGDLLSDTRNTFDKALLTQLFYG